MRSVPPVPECKRCGQLMRQPGRYAEWICPCCDESARCPHVGWWARTKRRLSGRRV